MEKILVAEDESIREELVDLLNANGYAAISQPPCDLALLDVNLPGENGFELCRKLRKQSGVPVIFLAARGSAEDELLAFCVGADDYIRKPYHSSVLLARRNARRLRRQSCGTDEKRNAYFRLPDEKGAMYPRGNLQGSLERQPVRGRKHFLRPYQPIA